jgi:hypothetical protein
MSHRTGVGNYRRGFSNCPPALAGANAVVGMRYDANDIMEGITEVLAYGTAVWVEPFAG